MPPKCAMPSIILNTHKFEFYLEIVVDRFLKVIFKTRKQILRAINPFVILIKYHLGKN